MLRSSLLSATAFAALVANPASAEPVTLLDLFSVDRIATYGAQWAVTALRGVADVRFVDMAVQPLAGRMVLSGLEITPYAGPPGVTCTIGVDRAVITTAPLDQVAETALGISLVGVSVVQGCLEAADLGDLEAFGITDLYFDSGRIDLSYTFASGALLADLAVVSADLAEIRAHAAFDYFAVDVDAEEPVIDLTRGEIEFLDRGVMSDLAVLIPPEAADAAALSAMLHGMLLPEAEPPAEIVAPEEDFPEPGSKQPGTLGADEVEPTPAPTAPAPGGDMADANAMIDDSAETLAGFLADPRRLVLTVAPTQPVRLTEEMFNDFSAFNAALQPRLSADALPAVLPVTGADIAAVDGWLDGSTPALADEAALRIARAFFSGVGAPRDPDRAMQILAPLLDNGNAAAVALSLEALDRLAPEQAYRIARRAAGGGDRTAFAHLDRLERALGLRTVIDIQDDGAAALTLSGAPTAHDLRDRAFAAFTGIATPRRYAAAYFYGLIALARGDVAAAAIVDDVEALGARLDEADAADWQAYLAAVRAEATQAWFDQP